MIGFLVPILLRWGGKRVTEENAGLIARILLGILAAILLAGFVWFMIARHDARVIEKHDAVTDLAVAQGARDADMTADNAAVPREAQHVTEAATDKETIRAATEAHPVEAARPSGPSVNAVADELRKRRASRVH